MNWLKDCKQRSKKELSVEEKAKLFQQLLEQRRKHFAAKRAEEKRNKPPTQAQQRKHHVYLPEEYGRKEAQRATLKNKSIRFSNTNRRMFDSKRAIKSNCNDSCLSNLSYLKSPSISLQHWTDSQENERKAIANNLEKLMAKTS
ncbi:hypothetical protein Tco_0724336 [Tanacetum coccineum]